MISIFHTPNTAKKVFCLLLACAALGATTAQADTLDKIMQSKKIRIAIDLAVPPYGMKDEKLNSTGSDVDTAHLLAKDLGVELEIVPTTGVNRIPFLQTGKADIVISSMSVTPDREKVVDFSLPYAAITSVVGAPKSVVIKGPADLVGKKIIATRGTTNDQEVTKILPVGAQLIRFDDDATSITAVISGQADIFATAPALLNVINEKNPAKQMEPKFTMKINMLAIGLRKNEPRLKERLDSFIKTELKSGELNRIYKKYHGADLPVELTRLGG